MVCCCSIGLLGMPPLHDSPELSPPVSCTHAAGAGGGQRVLNLAPSCASAPQDFQEWGTLFEGAPFGRGFESAVDPFFEHLQARSLSLSPLLASIGGGPHSRCAYGDSVCLQTPAVHAPSACPACLNIVVWGALVTAPHHLG